MSSSRNFNFKEQKTTLVRRIVQITAFVFINYVIIELIFSINLIAFEGTVKILPVLNSPRNPLSKGTGFIEFIFYSLAEGEFPFLIISLFFLITLFSGRFFCGWICPIGTIQDGLSTISAKKRTVRIDRHETYLNIKYVLIVPIFLIMLAMGIARSVNISFYFEIKEFLGSFGQKPLSYFSLSEYIFVSFPNMIMQMVSVQGIGPLFSNFLVLFTFIFYLGLLIATIWHSRAYCRYICPYGAICAIVSDYSFLKLSRSPVKCVGRSDCGRCEKVCPKQIRILDEPFEFFTGGGECNFCLKCKETCPFGAIGIKFG
jgi:polyferredoxin